MSLDLICVLLPEINECSSSSGSSCASSSAETGGQGDDEFESFVWDPSTMEKFSRKDKSSVQEADKSSQFFSFERMTVSHRCRL